MKWITVGRIGVILSVVLLAGCASTVLPHPRMFCYQAVASSDTDRMYGIICQPIPDDVPLSVIPAQKS